MKSTATRSPAGVSTRTTIAGGGALVAASLVGTTLAWSELPAEMVISWDASGSADGTASRPVAALLIPAIATALLGVFELIPRIDPLGPNFEQFRGYYNGFVLLMVAFLAAVHGVVLASNLGYEFAITPFLLGFVGIIFVYSSLLLRVAEPNWFVGIRTPWTLSSDEVWRRTHRLTSVLMAAVGVAVVFISVLDLFVTVGEVQVLVLAGGSFLIAGVSVVYSYYLYTKLGRPDDTPRTQ
jgi:uncharacterized membrane protein